MSRSPAIWLLSLALATSACIKATTADRVARGDKAMSQGDPAKAAKEYAHAAKDGEVTVDVLIKLGRARQDSGDRVGAAEAYTLALQRAPECQRCFAFLGVLAIDDGQFDRAETLLRNALLLDPADTVARNNLGFVFLNRRDLSAAYETYLKSLAYKPDDPIANLSIGRICRDYFHDISCAKTHFQRYLMADPGGSEAMELRAWIQQLEDSPESTR